MSSEWKSENWIAASWDKLHRGRHILLGIEQWIFRERSDFQEVAIARVPDWGKGLFLDAVVEFLESDEFVYHENFALPPVLFHPSPKRVLIEGGGDGLALREALRDPRVEEVVMVEIDGLVIDACKEHLKEVHRGSFDDPRARILIRDVLDYLEGTSDKFDVVLVDLLDGYDAPSLALYDKALPLTQRVLAPGAVVGGFGDLARPHYPIRHVYQRLRRDFANVALHCTTVETFSGGYGFLLASHDVEPGSVPPEAIRARAAALSGESRALVPESFPACFNPPPYLSAALEITTPAPTDQTTDAFGWLYLE